MICQKNKIIGFGIFLPVLLSVFFVSPSYAYDDSIALCSYEIDSEVYSNMNLCEDYLSEIMYVVFDFGVDSDDHSLSLRYNTFAINNNAGRTVFLMGFTNNPLQYSILQQAYGVGDGYSIYISFYSEWPNDYVEPCPEPEEPEPCPTCPVVPDNPYDDKLDNITKAIYVCAGTLLVLYFFYTIYRIIIRNSGVK